MKELGRKLRKLCTLKEKRLNDKSNWLKRELHKREWRQKKPRLSLMTFYSIELKVLDMLYNKHHMYLSLILSLSLSLQTCRPHLWKRKHSLHYHCTAHKCFTAHRSCYTEDHRHCLLYTSPSPRDATLSRMPSSA